MDRDRRSIETVLIELRAKLARLKTDAQERRQLQRMIAVLEAEMALRQGRQATG